MTPEKTAESAEVEVEGLTLPSLITALRILLVPVLYVLALRRMYYIFGFGLAAGALTDMLDGWLARTLRQKSRLGAQLDAAADFLFYYSTIVWFWWLRPDMVRSWWPEILIPGIPYVLGIMLKVKRGMGFKTLHLASTRVADVSVMIYVNWALWRNPPYIAVVAVALILFFSAMAEIVKALSLPARRVTALRPG